MSDASFDAGGDVLTATAQGRLKTTSSAWNASKRTSRRS
jgi:hypothetical protein